MEDLLIMKNRFNEKCLEIKSKKGKNHQLFTRDEYFTFLNKVITTKEKTNQKTPEDYQRLSRYDVVNIGNIKKLVVPVKDEKDPLIYYSYLEENFDIIHETHISIGHGGLTRMVKELKNKYKNITLELITIYLNLCQPCQKKMNIPKKGLVVRPIKSTEFNSRCQVDLIDMQSQADGQYKFIMVYQDHLTKFVQLRALKTKRAEEVGYHLLNIFTIFGAPCILHSDNGREFVNNVITEVCKMWDEPKIVHGKPRHSQSQGSVERANQDIEKMLATWLETNKTTHWSEGLRFIQFMKNKAFHSGINTSPYEAMFGCKPKIGLKAFLPAVDISHITSEEDLERLQNPQPADIDECNLVDHTTDAHSVDIHSQQIKPTSNIYPVDAHSVQIKFELKSELEFNSNQENSNEIPVDNANNEETFNNSENQNIDKELVSIIATTSTKIQEVRDSARESLQKQAEKMLKLSNTKFPVGKIGDSVRVRVPEVDRAKADSLNIIGVIMSVTDHNLYKLGTKYGVLNQLYSRNEFTVCKEKFVSIDDVPNTTCSLRECARKDSNLGGQGFQHCNCTGECNSNRCKCKKMHVLCNSKCHKSNSCKNK